MSIDIVLHVLYDVLNQSRESAVNLRNQKNNLRNHSQINPTNFQQISGIKDQSHEFISLTNHDETTPRNQKSMSGTMKPVTLLFLNSLAFFLILLSIATCFLTLWTDAVDCYNCIAEHVHEVTQVHIHIAILIH